MKLYKVLGPDRRPCHGGGGQWPEPGTWLEAPGPIALCVPGTLHLCRRGDLLHWLGPEIWEAEAEGKVVEGSDKVGALRARLVRRLDTWNESTARHFACDCAEYVAHLADDEQVRGAIMLARARAFGEDVPDEELDAAASAASAAARAAGAAAWVARNAAWAANAARDAASAAAWAARAAAWDARNAAGAAAWVARDAASAAAWAARAAAWTARDANADLTDRLFHYLEGGRP